MQLLINIEGQNYYQVARIRQVSTEIELYPQMISLTLGLFTPPGTSRRQSSFDIDRVVTVVLLGIPIPQHLNATHRPFGIVQP
jgi:hypothetical protein